MSTWPMLNGAQRSVPLVVRLAIGLRLVMPLLIVGFGFQTATDAQPAAAATLTPDPVLVANRGIDTSSEATIGTTVSDIGPSWDTTVTVQNDPSDIAVTADGQYAYVTNHLSGSVSVIQGADTPSPSVLTTLQVGGDPNDIAITPDQKYAYVTNAVGKVDVINGVDTTTPSVSATTLTVGSNPTALAITPDGDYIYVTNSDTPSVSVIDGASTGAPSVSSTPLSVGLFPGGVVVTPDGDYAYVTNFNSGSVSVIDGVQTGTPTVAPTPLAVGGDPWGVAIDGQYAYVANYESNTVSVIDGADSASPTVSPTTLSTGSSSEYDNPAAVAISPDGQYAYVTNYGLADGNGHGNTVTVIQGANTATPSVSPDTLSVGQGPYAVAVVPNVLTTSIPPLPPAELTAPTITGTPSGGQRLSCSTGDWSNDPTSFSYQWSRDETPIQGATQAQYVVQASDEQLTLTCAVTAMNAAGPSAPAISNGVVVPVPKVRGCPAATGRLAGEVLGLVRLGMTRTEARRAYRHSSNRGRSYEDFFCLTPIGVRVGYASPTLARTLSDMRARQLQGRVIWASTSSGYYSLDGIRPGATVQAARGRLKLAGPFRVGLNQWYLAPFGSSTAVLKVRGNIVEEIGIGDRQLTIGRKAQLNFLKSFY